MSETVENSGVRFQDLNMLSGLVAEVKSNFCHLLEEFDSLKQHWLKQSSQGISPSLCVIHKSDLQRMTQETHKLKATLPKLLSEELLNTHKELLATQNDLHQTQERLDQSHVEVDHWKNLCDSAITEVTMEKQEKASLRLELGETSRELTQQSEYCASMGSACATLLWRVSRCEESIQAILVGSKVDEFLSLVSSTLESYSQVCTPGNSQQAESQELSDETQFGLALCGIITNIAASPFGRDFLMRNENGRNLIGVFLKVLSDVPDEKYCNLKNLVLMCLYNVSINRKGLHYLQNQAQLVPLLIWLVQENRRPEIRVHSLRVIQSLLCEEADSKSFQLQLREALRKAFLAELMLDKSIEIQEVAVEIQNEIARLGIELHA